MKLKLFLALILAALLLTVLAVALSAQEEVPPPYAGLKNPFPWDDNTAQETGKIIYQQSCAVCHGASGRGGIINIDLATPAFAQRLEERPDFYFWTVSAGRTDKGKPAVASALSETQRWQVLIYLHSLGTEAAPPMAVSSTQPSEPLACLSCHNVVLKGHDKLGEESGACWACHDRAEMTTLRLASGEVPFPLTESPQLCAQCHQQRYKEWVTGAHGVTAWKEGTPEVRGSEKLACTSCHNPHQPQMVFTGITMPPSSPAPSPPSPPRQLPLILGAFVVVVILVIIGLRAGKEAL